jgi:hypothetical protein
VAVAGTKAAEGAAEAAGVAEAGTDIRNFCILEIVLVGVSKRGPSQGAG